MENDLNQFIEKESNYYKPQFKSQNVFKEKDFQLWYENAKIYIDKENKTRGIIATGNNDKDDSILTISFCNNCNCYAICSFTEEYSYINCNNCQSKFCIGCSRPHISLNDDESLCLKGYFKLLYLRTKYRRVGKLITSDVGNIIFIIFIILMTPAYLGFASNIIGLEVHPYKNKEFKNKVQDYLITVIIFSSMRAIVMIPYILFFLPFTIILLIPCIFSRKYFFTIAAFYTSAIDPFYIRNIYDDL